LYPFNGGEGFIVGEGFRLRGIPPVEYLGMKTEIED
jgi:hypothetical protein